MPSRNWKIRPALRAFSCTDSRSGVGQRKARSDDVQLGLDDRRRSPSGPGRRRVLQTGCTVTCMGLPLRWNSISHGLAAAAADDFMEAHRGVDRMASGAEDQIALLQPDLLGGHAGGDRAQLHFALFGPARACPTPERSSSTGVTVVSKSLPLRSMVKCMGRDGALDFFQDDVVPGGIALAVQA